jgi:hypothetical protein
MAAVISCRHFIWLAPSYGRSTHRPMRNIAPRCAPHRTRNKLKCVRHCAACALQALLARLLSHPGRQNQQVRSWATESGTGGDRSCEKFLGPHLRVIAATRTDQPQRGRPFPDNMWAKQLLVISRQILVANVARRDRNAASNGLCGRRCGHGSSITVSPCSAQRRPVRSYRATGREGSDPNKSGTLHPSLFASRAQRSRNSAASLRKRCQRGCGTSLAARPGCVGGPCGSPAPRALLRVEHLRHWQAAPKPNLRPCPS